MRYIYKAYTLYITCYILWYYYTLLVFEVLVSRSILLAFILKFNI